MLKLSLAAAAVIPLIALGTVAAGGDPAPAKTQHSHVFHEDLASRPIPAEWVVSGHPQARVKVLAQAEDEEVSAALWDCTAGTFNWHFSSDEIVHILEGEVKVSSERGQSRTLKAGDVAYFSAGTTSTWEVKKYVKKLAIVRTNQESLVRRAHRKLNQIFASL